MATYTALQLYPDWLFWVYLVPCVYAQSPPRQDLSMCSDNGMKYTDMSVCFLCAHGHYRIM